MGIFQYFNPKRFLQICNDSEEEIQRVVNQMVHMTEDEYLKIIHEPVFVNSLDVMYSIQKCINVS